MSSARLALSLAQARRAWLAAQGLGAPSGGTLSAQVAAMGWLPAPTAASAWLALAARGVPDAAAALDAAVSKGELAWLPGPRGMMWVVPASEAPLARAFAVADHAAREARIAASTEITSRELVSLRELVRRALEGPETPEALRAGLPGWALRPLGPVGKRVGCATVAGLVLRGLWCQGELVRQTVSQAVDEGPWRYAVAPWPKVVPNAADAVEAVGRRWFAAHGPASMRDFATAFGIALGRAQSALKGLGLVGVSVDALGDDCWVLPEFEVPPDAPPEGFALLPFRDALTDARPSLAGLGAESVLRQAMLKSLGPGPVVLRGGEAVAGWFRAPNEVTLTLRPWAPLGASERASFDAAAATMMGEINRTSRELTGHEGPRGRLPEALHPSLGGGL